MGDERPGRGLTVGEWMILVLFLGVILGMLTPTVRSWDRATVIPIVVILAWHLLGVSPVVAVVLRSRRRVGRGPDLNQADLLVASLLSVIFLFLLPMLLVRFVLPPSLLRLLRL